MKNKISLAYRRAAELLKSEKGASAIEIAGAAIIAIVLALIILNAYTNIFSDTIIPGLKSKIAEMFAIK